MPVQFLTTQSGPDIAALLAEMHKITPDHDAKLQHLKTQVNSKLASPINPGNKKILIFTAFADTAEYLYKHLAPQLLQGHKIHSGIVTGASTPRTTLKKGYDFQSLLTLFSPRSKEKALTIPNEPGEIDILIATDCISEGQNLQDCDYLINYDIHWNPVRIIQRFGRIDRIGSTIVEHLAYDPIEDRHSVAIFTQEKSKDSFAKAVKVDRHIYDYVFTDSKNERTFVTELDTGVEVVVYAKLPRGFFIPTPVGNYNPDWAIAFEQGKVKHIYFVAETKGSMSTLDLREIEDCKIKCARKFFAKITSEQVKYDVVDNYTKLMELVR